MAFTLHPQLAKDCIDFGKFELCRLLLMNDSQYPWFILVPEVDEVKEIYQLSQPQRSLLCNESNFLSERLARLFEADKMNIAAIGNIVSQLHIHHIVRYKTDKSWPAPVWGKFNAVPYEKEQLSQITETIKSDFKGKLF